MNIPARYCTGYLGDIGIPPVPYPMDFSAWFEVFLGDGWYTFDARHNTPRIGRILMARGRDAGDVPLTMAFGQNSLQRFEVTTYEVDSAGNAIMTVGNPLPSSSVASTAATSCRLTTANFSTVTRHCCKPTVAGIPVPCNWRGRWRLL